MLPQFAYLFLMDLTRLQSQTFDTYAAKEPGFADAMLQAYITAFQEPLTQKLTHAFLQTGNFQDSCRLKQNRLALLEA